MKRRVLGLGGLVVVVGIAVGLLWSHSGSDLPPVTEAEARAYLTQIVAAGQAHDFQRLCSLNGAVLNCRRQLEMAGEDAVPKEAPRVVGSRFEGKETSDDTPTMILVVEGIDGRGKPLPHRGRGVLGRTWTFEGHQRRVLVEFQGDGAGGCDESG
jgi:hypothetical protein